MIKKFIKENKLVPISKKQFEIFYVHNQGEIFEVFSSRKNLYFNVNDLDLSSNWIDVIYHIVDLPIDPLKRLQFVLELGDTSDGTEAMVLEGDKLLVKYWYD